MNVGLIVLLKCHSFVSEKMVLSGIFDTLIYSIRISSSFVWCISFVNF